MTKKGDKTFLAIILAAGGGSRLGGVMKQFMKFHGKPLILYSLEVFLRMPECGHIIVVVPKNKLKYMEGLTRKLPLRGMKIDVVSGGENRRKSALLGLEKAMSMRSDKWSKHVFFHDAARPMINRKMILRLRDEAERHGASTVGVTAVDLLFKVKDGFIESAVNKQGFHYGFTPQCLPLEQVWKAHTLAERSGLHHDMDNIEVLGLLKKKTKIRILDEFYPNIKLTYPGDRRHLSYLLRKRKRSHP